MDTDNNRPNDMGLGDKEMKDESMMQNAKEDAQNAWDQTKAGATNVADEANEGWQDMKDNAGEKIKQVGERMDSDSS